MPKPIAGFPESIPQSGDEFSATELNLQWVWNHEPRRDKWSLTERNGYLRLYAYPSVDKKGFFKAGNTINQRYLRSDTTVVTVRLEIEGMAEGQEAGLAHFNGGKSYAAVAVSLHQGMKRMKYETNGEITEGDVLPTGQQVFYLRTCVGFDNRARFQYSTDGMNFKELGGVYPLSPGNFRGDMIGIYTYNDKGESGYVDVDWFHYQVVNK